MFSVEKFPELLGISGEEHSNVNIQDQILKAGFTDFNPLVYAAFNEISYLDNATGDTDSGKKRN